MSEPKALIIYDLLGYLVDNPDARDTIDGITEWWLLKREIGRRVVDVKDALHELVSQKYILQITGGDSRTHYRVNPRKREEIAALLADRSGHDH